MARKIERLLRADPEACTRDQKFDNLAELTRLRARVNARIERHLASIHDPADGKQWARDEVACELRWSPDYAKTRLMRATHLVDKLPRLLALHEAGRISDAHVRVAADLTCHLDQSVIEKAEEKVLDRVAELTVTQFRSSLRRTIARLDTRHAEQRHVEATAERLVHCSPLPDAMAGIWSTHTAADGEAMYARITELAKQADAASDARSMDQRRADVLRDLVLGRTQAGTPARGMRVQLLVRQDTADGSSDLPGELAGYGPIPASQCREILADQSTRIDRVLVDSSGDPAVRHRRQSRTPLPLSSPMALGDRPASDLPIPGLQPARSAASAITSCRSTDTTPCSRTSNRSVATPPLQARRRLGSGPRLERDDLVDLSHRPAAPETDR